MAKILNVKIDDYSFKEVIRKINLFLGGKKLAQIVTVNPEFILASQKDSIFRKILNQADLSVPDGFGLKIAGLILKSKIGERITGVDLSWEIAKLAAKKGESIFLLGGGENIAFKASKRFKLLYPNLKIAGTYAGSPTEKGIVERINASGADILLVAFGAPKQDKFIYQNRHKLKCKLAMGVGGTFDYISGNIPRAPLWMRELGMEWFYRLFHQPSRFGRIFRAVIIFPLTVIIKDLPR